MDPSRTFETLESWQMLGEKVLAPARPFDAEVRAAAADHDDADALLEALTSRDVIPTAWLDAPAARFGSPVDRGLVAALAGDPAGVQRVEALALECMARCVAWGARPARSVRWRPLPRDEAHPRLAAHLPVAIEASIVGRVGWDWKETRDLERAINGLSAHLNGPGGYGERGPGWGLHLWRIGGLGRQFLVNLKRREEWRLRVTKGAVVERASRAAPPGLVGRPFAELASPFEPLVELWSTGYYATSWAAPVVELCAPVPAGF